MCPVAAAVDDDEFVATCGGAEFGGIGAWRNTDGFFVHQSPALGLGEGGACGKNRDEKEDREFLNWE
jgi:hypothetical protein